MISRTTFCSAQASMMRPARTRPMPSDLAQPLGRRLDDVEHVRAERPHQLAGVDRADAPDHAGAEILLDALAGRRGRAAQEARPELLAVGAVVDPLPGDRDPLAGRDRGGVAHDRDQVAMAPRLDPQDAEPVFGVVEGDALDRTGQDLPVSRSRLAFVPRRCGNRQPASVRDGGEGGIRTHVPVSRQDAFEAPPLRPLRYLSANGPPPTGTAQELTPATSSRRLPADRRWRKNACMSSRHSASSTPPTMATRWLSAGCSSARITDRTAPERGSGAP